MNQRSENLHRRIAVVLHDLRGGGAERVNLRLIQGLLESGRNVDLVLVQGSGSFVSEIPAGARVFDLKKKRVIQSIFALARYLKRERPVAVISSLTHVNLAAIIGVWLSRVRVKLVVCEHNQISQRATVARGLIGRLTYRAVGLLYPRASAIVAVSKWGADDLTAFAGLQGKNVQYIYNPVYDESISISAAEPPSHPWFSFRSVPIILAIGRLSRQKGFDVLLHAFQRVRNSHPCRLIILGEGDERASLEKLCQKLGIADDVSLPGFVANPFALMAQSDLFVLSSRWEGLPTVLIEALACGVPVVSTDCPGGSREILDNGRYGTLVPPEDPEALSNAILQSLTSPKQTYPERGKAFSTPASVARYLEVLES